jgi:hypothetical protein
MKKAKRTSKRKRVWTCPLCGAATADLIRHLDRLHAYAEEHVEALDALEDIVPGVPQYARVLWKESKRLREVAELDRIYKLRGPKARKS